MYAAELVDVSTDTLTKSMAKQIKSMKSAADGSKTFVEAYDKLGVSVTNADGTLRDGDEVYWELIDSLGKMENETERDALAMTLLGKSAQELNPLISAGAERMKELGKEAQAAGYVVSEDMLNAYGALDDNIQYLKVNAEGAKNALGTVLLPVLTELAGSGKDLLGEFAKGIQDANGDIGKMGDVIVNHTLIFRTILRRFTTLSININIHQFPIIPFGNHLNKERRLLCKTVQLLLSSGTYSAINSNVFIQRRQFREKFNLSYFSDFCHTIHLFAI